MNVEGVRMVERPLISYGEEGAMFLGDYVARDNATCSHCGKVEMPFVGVF